MEAELEERTARSDRIGISPGGVFSGAMWLAGKDARRTWLSFPAAALAAAVGGGYSVVTYGLAFGDGPAWIGSLVLDVWFFALVAVLSVNFLFNRDYYYRIREDNLSKRLAFLRGLPISAAKIVLGRAAIMLLTLACTFPCFFLTPYLASGGLRERATPAEYLWFVAFWLGYALFMVGVLVFVWLGLSWETERRVLLTLPVLYLTATLASTLLLENGLVVGVLDLARSAGPVFAAAPIVGVVGLLLGVGAATRGLRGREL